VDDGTLLARAGRGDEEAFAELYARYQGPLYRYASHMCGNAADDIVQETFLAVLRRPHAYDALRGTVGQYLFGIARHHVLQRIGASHEEPPFDADEAGTTPLDELLQTESVSRVRSAVEALPPVYREVVALCELQEMPYQTAASILECPVGTIRSRLHRARMRLARILSAPGAAAAGERR
jgi:RNA polymerase sigma-70 factor (ECF subfamily)